MPAFEPLQDDYARLWATMEIRADKNDAVTRIAHKLIAHKATYREVEVATGVPWFVIAALHNRESDADFSTYLGNGEPLDRVTRLVPKGRGPFASWQAGAIDALRLDRLDQVTDWTAARACYEIEKFNGFGYRAKGLASPYLWSFSNHYARGKYVADGRFDLDAVDRQCGAIPILKRIMELDSSARFNTPVAVKQPAIVATTGGSIATLAHTSGASGKTVVAILIATLVIAGIAYAVARTRS